jgi:hypothetical protein
MLHENITYGLNSNMNSPLRQWRNGSSSFLKTGRQLHNQIVSIFDGYKVLMLCLNGYNDHLQLPIESSTHAIAYSNVLKIRKRIRTL